VIYDSWKTELEKLNKPYYLKIWLYEPRISKSQVVCAIDDKIEYYDNIFEKADFKENNSSFTKQLSSDFNWQPTVDEEPYWESELLWPIDQYERIEDSYSDRTVVKHLMRTKQTQNLIDKYEKFSGTFENDSLKSLMRTDILKLYSEIDNPNEEDYYTMGLFHYGDYEEKTPKDLLNERTNKAISFFQSSLESDPNYYMSNYYLGHCYQDLGRYEKAIEY